MWWILSTLILPLITASATSDNPPGASQSDTPSTSQTTCTMSDAGISVHNIIQHNRDIFLSKSPSVEWVPNQPKVAPAYGPGLVLSPPPWLITGLYQCLIEGGWEKLVVKQWTWSIRYKVLHKRRPTKIKPLACTRSEQRTHLQEAYRCQETTH